jgi:hypothetical protein
VENVFQHLHAAIQAESATVVIRKPLPHEIISDGQKILFEDLWNLYGDEDKE